MADIAPSNIIDLYQRYKESTKYALLWLASYSGRTTNFGSTK